MRIIIPYGGFHTHLVFIREQLDQLELLEVKDPQACRVCLEREELEASQEPRETE